MKTQCPDCNGCGVIVPSGIITSEQADCTFCKGTGKIVRYPNWNETPLHRCECAEKCYAGYCANGWLVCSKCKGRIH